eukprot:365431-Chlamydomonas_euryale.AAC.13
MEWMMGKPRISTRAAALPMASVCVGQIDSGEVDVPRNTLRSRAYVAHVKAESVQMQMIQRELQLNCKKQTSAPTFNDNVSKI